MQRVKRLIQSDLTKILIFFTLTSIAAAIISPWLYNAGKMIAEVAESRGSNSLLLWFAQKCDSVDFPQYFNRALLLSSLLLAGPFIMWMRIGKGPKPLRKKPWGLRLPNSSVAHSSHSVGQPLRHNDRGLLHLCVGVFLASSLMLLMMWMLILSGWFTLERPALWWDVIKSVTLSSVLIALIGEWIFRGVFLGICLRSMRPSVAIVIVSACFAAVHFLSPPAGVHLTEPGNWDAGFRMMALIGQRFLHLHHFLMPFLTLFVVGLILAYARYRTASLWLPIGLHIGWVLVHRIFQPITEISGEHLAVADLFISADRKAGILPLCLLFAAGLLVHVFIRVSEEKRSAREEKNIESPC